jgi:hypothetical protein
MPKAKSVKLHAINAMSFISPFAFIWMLLLLLFALSFRLSA